MRYIIQSGRRILYGKEIKVYKTDYLFHSVLLKPGEYKLVFKFYNNGSYIVTALIHYIISIFGIILYCKKPLKKIEFY